MVAMRIQCERLVKSFRVAAIALGVFFVLAFAATIMSIQREAQTKIQVAGDNTQVAVAGKTLTPILTITPLPVWTPIPTPDQGN